MNGNRALRIVAPGLLLGLCACRGEPDTVALGPLEITGDTQATDPCLFRWPGDDTYWVFSTGTSGGGIDRHNSQDLKDFQKRSPILAPNPTWIGQTLSDVTNLWSPELSVFGGRTHLYYAASQFYTKNGACLGHATAGGSDQLWQDQGSVICSKVDVDKYEAIDPAVFLDAPDSPWLVFGSGRYGIFLIALDPTTGNRRDATMTALATRSAGLQASFLYRWHEYYYLFVSFDYSPSHSLHVGRSRQLKGEYFDRDGVSMLKGGGTLLVGADKDLKGPGSNSIFNDNGKLLNVYHAYDGSHDGGSTSRLRLAPVYFDNDGWPVTAGP